MQTKRFLYSTAASLAVVGVVGALVVVAYPHHGGVSNEMMYERDGGIGEGIERALSDNGMVGMWTFVAGVEDDTRAMLSGLVGKLPTSLLNDLPPAAQSVGVTLAYGGPQETPFELLFVAFDDTQAAATWADKWSDVAATNILDRYVVVGDTAEHVELDGSGFHPDGEQRGVALRMNFAGINEVAAAHKDGSPSAGWGGTLDGTGISSDSTLTVQGSGFDENTLKGRITNFASVNYDLQSKSSEHINLDPISPDAEDGLYESEMFFTPMYLAVTGQTDYATNGIKGVSFTPDSNGTGKVEASILVSD